jgi:hypothetical protein
MSVLPSKQFSVMKTEAIFSSEATVNIHRANVITLNNVTSNYVSYFFLARGKLKKTLHPIILGLVVKGAIVLASVIGLVMKVIAAKAVLLGMVSVIFGAVAIFKKYSAPQGGTIYVHTKGAASHKNGGSWDKEGFGPHRVSKDAIGYQAWDNYGRRQRGDYSTPAATGDRYHQHYNSYYRPNSAAYSTSVSPYVA